MEIKNRDGAPVLFEKLDFLANMTIELHKISIRINEHLKLLGHYEFETPIQEQKGQDQISSNSIDGKLEVLHVDLLATLNSLEKSYSICCKYL